MPETTPPDFEAADEASSSADRWETLEQAFASYRFPLENLTFIRPLAQAVGISHYEGIQSRSYIKGIRQAGGRILHIHFGYTGGITEESVITESLGDVDRGTWGEEWWVSHPLNKLRGGNGSSTRGGPGKDYGVCSNCFRTLPASGECDCA